jgi:hypothetical protein
MQVPCNQFFADSGWILVICMGGTIYAGVLLVDIKQERRERLSNKALLHKAWEDDTMLPFLG